jgi:hypothetical protein
MALQKETRTQEEETPQDQENWCTNSADPVYEPGATKPSGKRKNKLCKIQDERSRQGLQEQAEEGTAGAEGLRNGTGASRKQEPTTCTTTSSEATRDRDPTGGGKYLVAELRKESQGGHSGPRQRIGVSLR